MDLPTRINVLADHYYHGSRVSELSLQEKQVRVAVPMWTTINLVIRGENVVTNVRTFHKSTVALILTGMISAILLFVAGGWLISKQYQFIRGKQRGSCFNLCACSG
jgi:hypothetical protein